MSNQLIRTLQAESNFFKIQSYPRVLYDEERTRLTPFFDKNCFMTKPIFELEEIMECRIKENAFTASWSAFPYSPPDSMNFDKPSNVLSPLYSTTCCSNMKIRMKIQVRS